MILNHNQLIAAQNAGEITIEPFNENQVEPASYDLRVGSKGLTTSSNGQVDIEIKAYIDLKPGDFGILFTREKVKFGLAHTARIGLRSSYARKGIVATMGAQIDPGFEGRLKIGLTNLSPNTVSFPFEDDLVTIEVHRLGEKAQRGYNGPYQGVDGFTPEEVKSITEGGNTGLGGTIEELRSLSKNVGRLATGQKFLQWAGSFGFAVLLAVGLLT